MLIAAPKPSKTACALRVCIESVRYVRLGMTPTHQHPPPGPQQCVILMTGNVSNGDARVSTTTRSRPLRLAMLSKVPFCRSMKQTRTQGRQGAWWMRKARLCANLANMSLTRPGAAVHTFPYLQTWIFPIPQRLVVRFLRFSAA